MSGYRGRPLPEHFYDSVLSIVGLQPISEGLRPAYDANYYGAFVRDPDGHKMAAVTYSAR